MLLGSHVSIKGGFLEAAKLAQSIGARSFQYFPKNPRSLALKTFDRQDAAACAAFCRQIGMPTIAHTPYPTNLALAEAERREAVKRSLLNDLDIAEACGSIGVVVHFGVYRGTDTLQGYKNILQLVNDVCSEWQGRALLLIENQAGEGTPMGTTLEELVQIRALSACPEKIGFCLDTCHLFASGVWNGADWHRLWEHAARIGYAEQVRAVHLNDSVYPAGSRKDRHANVGRGRIGERGLLDVLGTPMLQEVPFVLETPAYVNYTHREELHYLMSLINVAKL